jgi:hypothetical protein
VPDVTVTDVECFFLAVCVWGRRTLDVTDWGE